MTDEAKMVIEVDCTTGVVTERPMTEEEIANAAVMAETFAAQQAIFEKEMEEKAQAKASAEAKLSALGLTPSEIAALSS